MGYGKTAISSIPKKRLPKGEYYTHSRNRMRIVSTTLVQPYICCFNQNSKEAIVEGLKNKIDISEVLTG